MTGNRRKRVVIDTNVIVSILLFGGDIDVLRLLWQERTIDFLISKDVLDEYLRVLAYPKFKLTTTDIKGLIEVEILPFVTTVSVKTMIKYVQDDPDDDKFLSLAVDGKADCIVSGDKHLLNVKEFKEIPILTARAFLERV